MQLKFKYNEIKFSQLQFVLVHHGIQKELGQEPTTGVPKSHHYAWKVTQESSTMEQSLNINVQKDSSLTYQRVSMIPTL